MWRIWVLGPAFGLTMRRGGRGSNLQAPWRGRDNAIPSALHLERGWAVGNYMKVVVLAACSIAIPILIWRLQRGRPPGSHHNLESRNPGLLFPLYQYYQQYANGSHIVVGGRERWRGSRVGNGRGIQSDELNPMLKLRLGHRSRDDRNTEFYIEMKLGDPPKPFYFQIDTGSGSPWVHCAIPEYESNIADFGPNGRFVSKDKSIVKCVGPTESLCRALQSKVACNEEDNYECMFSALYGDDSYYEGVVVNASLTLPMQDITERTVFALFGCVLDKESRSETLPLLTDGIVGLGKCEGSLVDQLSTSKAIIQKVLGVCLAKEIRETMLRPAGRVGYVSLGKDFEEKFDQSKSVWAKLVGPIMDCDYAAKLLFISIGNIRFTVGFESHDLENAGMALGFDTGTDLAFLRKDVYDQVLDALDSFTWNGDYFRVRDDENYVLREQRLCWHYRGKKRKRGGNHLGKASPIDDFPALKFEFEGIAATEIPELQHILQYLIVQPEKYLTWDADRRKLCVNILPENNVPGMPSLGVQMMREHLFVFDIENHRVRWNPSSECEL